MQKKFDDKNVITTSKTGMTEIGMAETETVETETVETETTVPEMIDAEKDEDAIRQEKVSIAISIGEELIKNGGEVSRVEDTLERLLGFYHFGRPNVFVVSNGIFLTVDEGTKNTITCVRTIPYWSTNLEKISLLNALSRQICQGKCSVREA